MAATGASSIDDVPELARCQRCGRWCMAEKIAEHEKLCGESAAPRDEPPARAVPGATTRKERPTSFAWDERPATAPSLREELDLYEQYEQPSEEVVHVACPTCGRMFTRARLAQHRKICARRALPGFRAAVYAMERSELDDELVRLAAETGERRVAQEREGAEALLRRAEDAERRAAEAEKGLADATRRLEREKAAAKSMEASYDVMAEAVEDGKKREAELQRRLERAELAATAAQSTAEREKAAAKSMEAAHDVQAEAVEDGKKREAVLQRRLERAELAATAAQSTAEREKAAAKSMEASYDVMAEAVEDGKKREAELQRRLDEAGASN